MSGSLARPKGNKTDSLEVSGSFPKLLAVDNRFSFLVIWILRRLKPSLPLLSSFSLNGMRRATLVQDDISRGLFERRS